MAKKEELIRFSGTLPLELSEEFKKKALLEQRSLNAVFNDAIKVYLNKCQPISRELIENINNWIEDQKHNKEKK